MTVEHIPAEEVSDVIGPAAPMPTETEGWAAWKRAYVARWVEKGFDDDWGKQWFDAEKHELRDDPAAAADDDMEYLDGE